MRVLIACEFSGRVRDAFLRRGHDAWSCDLLPCLTDPTYHLRHDARTVLRAYPPAEWDLIIAHPPCTYLCNSGAQFYHSAKHNGDGRRWESLRKGAEFFSLFLKLDCPRVCVENPIPHKYAKKLIGRDYTQTIRPYQFGGFETKTTCLWLKGLDSLYPTRIRPKEDRLQIGRALSPSPTRWMERSKTDYGIAEAMAEQWG